MALTTKGGGPLLRIKENGRITTITDGTWDNIYSRARFTDRADSDVVELVEMIGDYRLYPAQPCGLTNCRTPHNNGRIVRLSDNRETIIGHICGKRHFPEDFETTKSAYDREVNMEQFRDNVTATQARVPALLRRVEQFSEGDEHSVSDVYKRMHEHMTKLFDGPTIDALKRMARTGDGRVNKVVELTKEEREIEEQFGSGAEYRTEMLFIIQGIRAATSYRRLRPSALHGLRTEIANFAELKPGTLKFMELKRQNTWANSIDSRLKELDDVLLDCQRFLTAANLRAIIDQKYIVQKSQ